MKFVLSPHFIPIKNIPEIAVVADQYHWEAITLSDHVIHLETINTPYPYTEDGSRRWEAFTEWTDPWVMIGGLATITKQIRFTNNVFVLPMRNPFLAAKAVATAAVLSDDRITLTIGIGWSKDEFELLQQDFHNRGKRCDEMVAVMRKLWTGKMVEHHGEYYDFPPLEMNPAPKEYIPIWVGGMSKFALKRAARIGDGWISDFQTSEDIIQCINTIQELRKEYGRDHLPFEVLASPSDAFDIKGFSNLAKYGVSHILTQPWQFYFGDTDKLSEQIEGIKRFSDDYILPMSSMNDN